MGNMKSYPKPTQRMDDVMKDIIEEKFWQMISFAMNTSWVTTTT